MQRIAVVLLNWNGLDLLKKFLPSVVKHSSEAAVYVADNASTDASRAFIAKNYPEVKWIQLPQNYGYAKGYNEALRSEEHTSELQSRPHLVCRLLLEKKT